MERNRSALNRRDADRPATGAIALFVVVALFLLGMLIKHLSEGSAWFFREDLSAAGTLLAFPARGFGLLASYVLGAALIGFALSLWRGRPIENIPRRMIGLTLMMLAIAGSAGVVHELAGADGAAPWGGVFGTNLATGFLSLGTVLGILGKILAIAAVLALLAFGAVVAQDWFFYSDLKSWLGTSAAAPAFAVGMGQGEGISLPGPAADEPDLVRPMTKQTEAAPEVLQSEAVAVLEPPVGGAVAEEVLEFDDMIAAAEEAAAEDPPAVEIPIVDEIDEDDDLMFGAPDDEVPAPALEAEIQDADFDEFMVDDQAFDIAAAPVATVDEEDTSEIWPAFAPDAIVETDEPVAADSSDAFLAPMVEAPESEVAAVVEAAPFAVVGSVGDDEEASESEGEGFEFEAEELEFSDEVDDDLEFAEDVEFDEVDEEEAEEVEEEGVEFGEDDGIEFDDEAELDEDVEYEEDEEEEDEEEEAEEYEDAVFEEDDDVEYEEEEEDDVEDEESDDAEYEEDDDVEYEEDEDVEYEEDDDEEGEEEFDEDAVSFDTEAFDESEDAEEADEEKGFEFVDEIDVIDESEADETSSEDGEEAIDFIVDEIDEPVTFEVADEMVEVAPENDLSIEAEPDPIFDTDLDPEEMDEEEAITVAAEIEDAAALFDQVQELDERTDLPAEEAMTIFEVNRLADDPATPMAPAAELVDDERSILEYAATASPTRQPAAGPGPQEDDWASWMDGPAAGIAKTRAAEPEASAAGTPEPETPVQEEDLTAEPRQLQLFDTDDGLDDDDYQIAVSEVLDRDQCSVSMLQRELGMTFAAAAAAIEKMERDGIVGPYRGTGSREILTTKAEWETGKD